MGGAQYADLAGALTDVTDGQTIKLLNNITYSSQIIFNNGQSVTFDLNGFVLNATAGLLAANGSQILLKDPNDGELNASCKAAIGSFTVHGHGPVGKIEVTSISTDVDHTYAAYASTGGEIIVYGNVTNNATSGSGVHATSGCTVTVEGIITVSAGVTYIRFLGTTKTQSEYEATSTRTGYLEYTDGASTVWVKVPVDLYLGSANIGITAPATGATPQSTITAGTGYTGTITWSPAAATFAASTVYTATVTLTSTAGYQWPATAPAITVPGGTVSGGTVAGTGTGNTLTFDVTFPATAATAPPSYAINIGSFAGGSVSANHTTATAGTTVTLTITPDTDAELLTLTVRRSDGSNVTLSGTGATRTFTMPAASVTVTATFQKNDLYSRWERAKALIEAAQYTVPQEKAGDANALRHALAEIINQLITGTDIVISPSDIVIFNNFLPATAGDAGKQSGTNGFFEFRVSPPNLSSAYADGTITATPFDPTSNEKLKVENGKLKVWTGNGTLHVEGITSGEMLNIYSVTGLLVYRNIIPSETADIPLAAKGIYFVRHGSQTVKIINN